MKYTLEEFKTIWKNGHNTLDYLLNNNKQVVLRDKKKKKSV